MMLSIIPELQMMSSNVTRLNIPVTHLMSYWMEKTGMIGYCSQNSGMVSNQITKIYKDTKVETDNK